MAKKKCKSSQLRRKVRVVSVIPTPTGKAVAELRAATGLNTLAFAHVLAVSSSTPGHWERFGRRNVSADPMHRQLLYRLTKAPRKATVKVFERATRIAMKDQLAGFSELVRFAVQ